LELRLTQNGDGHLLAVLGTWGNGSEKGKDPRWVNGLTERRQPSRQRIAHRENVLRGAKKKRGGARNGGELAPNSFAGRRQVDQSQLMEGG